MAEKKNHFTEELDKHISEIRTEIREQAITLQTFVEGAVGEKIDPLDFRIVLETYKNTLGRAIIIGHELHLIFQDMEIDLDGFSQTCGDYSLKEAKKRFFGILKSYTERLSFVPGVLEEDYIFFFSHVDTIISDHLVGKDLLYKAIKPFLLHSRVRTKLLKFWKML